MTPLEKAVEASTRFSLIYSHGSWRLYDNDVRVDGPWSGDDYILAHEVLSTARAKAAIRAFLEAAAEQQGVCWMVADAFVEAEKPFGDTGSTILDDAGKAAILALKETVNG